MQGLDGRFRPGGVITLTTDFGLDDPFVGIMKGVIAREAPGINVIDLCHEVPPFRPEIGGLWIGRCYRWFATGTVHVAVVDPGVGTDRHIVCLESPGHLFLAPDNGLAGELARHLQDWSAVVVEPDAMGLEVPSGTFHGRDIFAPVAARLASGSIEPAGLGPPLRDLLPSSLPCPRCGEDGITGEVLLEDRFGNVFTNIPGPVPATWRQPTISIGQRNLRLVMTYDEAAPGEMVGIFNSFGLLEIAIPRGSAAEVGSWPAGTPVRMHESPERAGHSIHADDDMLSH